MSSIETSIPAASSHHMVPEHRMPIREMYNLSTKQEGAFGINGYQVPAAYHDARLLKEQREKTMQKKAPKATVVPDYLTQITKTASKLPGPIYDIVKPWVDEKKAGGAPKNVGQRKTYIEEIGLEAKRRPIPGPGAYDLLKKDEKKASGIKGKGGERTNFLMDSEWQADSTPGPGNYNARLPLPKLKQAKLKPEEWRKKHQDEAKVKKAAVPDAGTYSPIAVDFNTFDRTLERSKSHKNGNSKTWGTEIRFDFEKKNKKPEVAPGPGEYKVTTTWGPDMLSGKKDAKHVNLFNVVTKGISKSIYYS